VQRGTVFGVQEIDADDALDPEVMEVDRIGRHAAIAGGV